MCFSRAAIAAAHGTPKPMRKKAASDALDREIIVQCSCVRIRSLQVHERLQNTASFQVKNA